MIKLLLICYLEGSQASFQILLSKRKGSIGWALGGWALGGRIYLFIFSLKSQRERSAMIFQSLSTVASKNFYFPSWQDIITAVSRRYAIALLKSKLNEHLFNS